MTIQGMAVEEYQAFLGEKGKDGKISSRLRSRLPITRSLKKTKNVA